MDIGLLSEKSSSEYGIEISNTNTNIAAQLILLSSTIAIPPTDTGKQACQSYNAKIKHHLS